MYDTISPLSNHGLQLENSKKKLVLRCNCSNGSNEYDVPPVKVHEAENHVRRR